MAKKNNIVKVGILTAVVATIGGIIASLLSNKKTRGKIVTEIKKAEKTVKRKIVKRKK